MAHPGLQGRRDAPVRSPEHSPGVLGASWDPMHTARTRAQQGGSRAFNQVRDGAARRVSLAEADTAAERAAAAEAREEARLRVVQWHRSAVASQYSCT